MSNTTTDTASDDVTICRNCGTAFTDSSWRERTYCSHDCYVSDIRIPRNHLLDDLIAGYSVLGVWPRYTDYADNGQYSAATIKNRFDDWDAAIQAAKARLDAIGGLDAWRRGGAVDD